jgi:hypothetical protein
VVNLAGVVFDLMAVDQRSDGDAAKSDGDTRKVDELGGADMIECLKLWRNVGLWKRNGCVTLRTDILSRYLVMAHPARARRRVRAARGFNSAGPPIYL